MRARKLGSQSGEAIRRKRASRAKRPEPVSSKANSLRLEQELAVTRKHLQTLSERHAAATEKLLWANEQTQSTNEDLRIMNEELATSKEEIQASNEELRTLIDELKSRNLELGQVNSDLTNLISSVQVATVIVGRDLCIRRFSPMAEKLLNIIPTDIGRPFTDIRIKVGVPELDSLLTEVIDSATPQEREVQAEDGRWYSLRVRPYMTVGRKIDGAVLMLTDVDAIQRAREFAECIVATVRDPLLVLSDELRVRSANQAFYRAFGVEHEETEGRLVHELCNGRWDIPELHRLLRDLRPGVSKAEDFVGGHKFEPVGDRAMRFTARKLTIPGEEHEAILLVIEDISELSHLETAARESEEKFKLLFDRSPLPKWTFAVETLRIIDVNQAAVELYGYSREELLRMAAVDLCTPETGESLQAELAGPPHRLPLREICTHRKKSGESIDVEVRLNEVELEGERVLLVSVNDITERNRLDKELRERAEELDAANRSKSDFIAVLSHELRSPLNAIYGWAELLKRPGMSEDDRRKGVEIIARNARIQAQLISDLLDVHRIATGKLSLELRTVDLRGEVEAAIDAVLPASQQKKLRIELDGGPAPAFILGDSARLQQVLGNLLANAVKFTPGGGEIRVTLRQHDGRAEVIVSDSGQGISSEALPHIFERFRQSEPLAAGVKSGLGLGLAISKELAELHGGSVSARSLGKGKGSTFTVWLPLISQARPAVAAIAVGPGASSEPLIGFMVLVVDDEAEAREPVRRVLEEHGAEVVSVRSADEALDAIRQQRPDVIVSDIAMPGRDGYELMRAIRGLSAERGGRIPAIALTAFGTAADCERALHAGYMTHFAKPVEPAALIAEISRLIPRHP